MLRITLTYFISLFCIYAATGQLPSGEPTSVQFKILPLDQAIKLATEQGKPLFIDSYAKWCIPCKKMDAVFRDREVAKVLNDNFINVKVNMDQPYGKEYQARYGVIFLPTFLFLDHLGNNKIKVDRVLTKYELIAYANAAIGKSTFASTSTAPPSTTYTQTTRSTRKTTTTSRPRQTYSNPPAGTTKSASGATTRASASTTTASTRPVRRSGTTRRTATPPATTPQEEKILSILKPEDMNPDILYQEAYMGMQMMDGSHWYYADQYLKTQANWSSPKNMRFVFDFVRYTNTKEFNYIIKNRDAFNKLIGKENVDRSIEILVYTRMNQGIPRPDLKEAISLYNLTTVSDPKGRAYKYYIKRLLDENRKDELLTHLKDYMLYAEVKDAKILNLYGHFIAKESKNRNELLKGVKAVEDAIKINSSEPTYWKTLAVLHTKLGNRETAIKSAKRSLALTPPSDQETISYLKDLMRKNH